MRPSYWLVGIFVALSAACGGNSNDSEKAAWVEVAAVSPSFNRYLEASCRYNARCNDVDFVECNRLSVGFYCEPASVTLTVPDLAACIEALTGRDCQDEGYTSECFPARNAIRAPRDHSLVREGEACDETKLRCDFDLFCTGGPGQCGECQKQGKTGDACRDWQQCAERYYCANSGRCAERKGADQACDVDADECTAGLVCLKGKCGAVELALVGDPCDVDFDCNSNFCGRDGACVPSAQCGQGVEGDRCYYDLSCKTGYICESGRGECIKPVLDGKACDPAADTCAADSYCELASDGSVYRCTKRLRDGERCNSPGEAYSTECASDYCDLSGTCQPSFSSCIPEDG